MVLDQAEAFELLKAELPILQQRLAKYDDLLWTLRSWAVAITSALIGWAAAKLSQPESTQSILTVSALVPLLFWVEEGMLRTNYQSKYISRYRLLRSALNGEEGYVLHEVALYDLSNKLGRRPGFLRRAVSSFFRAETALFYLVLGLVAVMVRQILSASSGGP